LEGTFPDTPDFIVFGNVRLKLTRENTEFSLRDISNWRALVETLVNPLAGLELGAEKGVFSRHLGGNVRQATSPKFQRSQGGDESPHSNSKLLVLPAEGLRSANRNALRKGFRMVLEPAVLRGEMK
jgi:hypothetical protein